MARSAGDGEARWNTPNGLRPTLAEVQETTARLLRPLKINVNDTIEGSAAAAGHAVSRGGKLGCDSVSYSDDQTLIVGERYVFFLAPITDSRAMPSDDMLAFDAWSVDAAGNVAVPNAGTLTLAELQDALERGVAPTAPPRSGEPPEPTPSATEQPAFVVGQQGSDGPEISILIYDSMAQLTTARGATEPDQSPLIKGKGPLWIGPVPSRPKQLRVLWGGGGSATRPTPSRSAPTRTARSLSTLPRVRPRFSNATRSASDVGHVTFAAQVDATKVTSGFHSSMPQ